uniref:Retroviral polymerase SH3-like domain-containing protein n=1 Tax=Cajanus cajan TaxID=3821 RepID=A0A151TDF0_CAJCA|nr:hypothetical protein KK1_019707 [Cajanus cajan]
MNDVLYVPIMKNKLPSLGQLLEKRILNVNVHFVERQSSFKLKIHITNGGGEIFGSLCYKHIPHEKRTKLDDKSEVFIMFAYRLTSAYKLYSPH